MKILIIGGTGFIGPYVVKELVKSGHEVAIFSRGYSIDKVAMFNIHTINGDKKDLFHYRDQFINYAPDVVIHMHAYTKYDAEEAMKTFEGVARRITVLSSMDVYQAYGILIGLEDENIVSTPLLEESLSRQKFHPYGGDYEKLLVEDIVMNSVELPGTILRLPMVYGPGDPSNRLYKYAKRIHDGRKYIVLDELFANWRSSRGYVEDVAHAIALAATNDIASNKIYNVSEPMYITEHQWVNNIAQAMRWMGKIISIPREELPEELIYSSLNLKQNWITDSSKIRSELNYSEQVPSHEAISRTIEWELLNPPKELHSKDYPRFHYEIEDIILSNLKRFE